jgi:uncharacterized membrane protein YfcA
MDILFILSGLLVGLIIGVSGVGGGSLMTPLLVMGFGIPPATAVGTDLLYAGLTKTGCSIFRGKLGSINWKLASLLTLGSLPAAILTSIYFLGATHDAPQTSKVITQTLGFMLCVTAISFVFRKRLIALSGSVIPVAKKRSQKILIATLLLGAVLGVLVTLTSVGAGALGVTALLILYPGIPANHLAGTDIVHAVPLTLVAGASHAFLGSVDYSLLFTLLIGSIPGVILGSLVAHKISEVLLQLVIGSVLFAVGIVLIF